MTALQHPGEGPSHPSSARAAKTALRDQLLAARKRLPLSEVAEAAAAIRERLLESPEVRRAATVAAYASVGSEPGTGLLLDGLLALGKRVILPVLLPDDDLDWAEFRGSLASGRLGTLHPGAPPLGVDAIAAADLVLVPGLAVDDAGMRMGRGGGSYDRALGRVPVGTPVAILLYDHELHQRVPAEPHDRPVTAAVTPSGWLRFP